IRLSLLLDEPSSSDLQPFSTFLSKTMSSIFTSNNLAISRNIEALGSLIPCSHLYTALVDTPSATANCIWDRRADSRSSFMVCIHYSPLKLVHRLLERF